MASPFQRYQSGIEASTGNLVAASGQMAGQTANAIASVGQNLANGLSKYYDNQAKNEQVTGEGQEVAKSLQGYYEIASKDPELKEYAETFIKPALESFVDFHTLPFNKKAGVLAGAKAKQADMVTSLNFYLKTKDMKLKRDVSAGEDAGKGSKMSGKKPAVSRTRWNPYISGDENYNGFITQLATARKDGFTGDDDAAVISWIDEVEENSLNGTFEGATPEQSEQLRGPTLDSIAALREKIYSERISGHETDPANIERSKKSARDLLGQNADVSGAHTVVTDPSGKPVAVKIPAPASADPNINRGPVARYVNTKRGLVRVEVNQAFPSDIIAPVASATAVTAPAPAPAPVAVVAPEKVVVAPAPAPVAVIAPEKVVVPPAVVAPAPAVIAPEKVVTAPAPAPAAVVAPEKVAPAPEKAVAPVPEKLPAPPSKKPEPAATASAAPAAKEEYDLSTRTYARSMGVPVAEFAQAVKDSGLPAYEYYRDLQKAAKEQGMSVEEYYKAINKPAEEEAPAAKNTAPAGTPPPASAEAPAPAPAPEGLPEPERAPIKFLKGREAHNAKAQELIEKGGTPRGDGSVRYAVQQGDTLSRIAKKFGMSQKALEDRLQEEGKDWNKIKIGDTISVGKAYDAPAGESSDDEGSADYSEAATDASTESETLSPKKEEEARQATLAKEFTAEEKTRQTRIWGGSKRVIDYYKELQQDLLTEDPEKFDFNAWGALKKTSDYAGPLASGAELAAMLLPISRVVKAGQKGIQMTQAAQKLIDNGKRLGVDPKKLNLLRKANAEDVVDFFRGQVLKAGAEGFLIDILRETFDPTANDDTKYAGLSTDLVGKYQGGKGAEFSVQGHIEKTLDDIRQIRQYGLGIDREKLTATQKIKLGELLQSKIQELQGVNTTAWETGRNLIKNPITFEQAKARVYGAPIMPTSASSSLPDVAPLMGEVQTTLGTKDVTQEYSAEEKKDRLKAFLMERYKDSEGNGYIPSGFEGMYQALHPESQFKVFQTEIGPMYWDGSSIKPAPKQEAMSTDKIRESRRGMFGRQTEKGWMPEEVGVGTGVFLAGLFNRSDADLTKFDEMAVNNASGLQALKGIKEILKIPLHAIPFDKDRQRAYGKVQVYIAALKAAIRTDIVGVGTVSNFEQTMIKLAVPDPSELWRLDNADYGRIEELEKRLKSQLVNTGSMKGVSVLFKDTNDEKDVESSLRSGNNRLK